MLTINEAIHSLDNNSSFEDCICQCKFTLLKCMEYSVRICQTYTCMDIFCMLYNNVHVYADSIAVCMHCGSSITALRALCCFYAPFARPVHHHGTYVRGAICCMLFVRHGRMATAESIHETKRLRVMFHYGASTAVHRAKCHECGIPGPVA